MAAARGCSNLLADTGERGDPFGLLELRAQPAARGLDEDPAHLVTHAVRTQWLAEISRGVDRLGLRAPVRRDGQDGNVEQQRIRLLQRPEPPAVHDGHPQVQHDQIGALPRMQLVQRLLPVLRGRHAVALVREDRLQRVSDGPIVLDQQDSLARRRPSLA